jgi:hypothetical protein
VSLGSVIIGGQIFPITKLSLEHGECVIAFCIPPGPAFSGPITVFGSDGQGCWQGRVLNVPTRNFHVYFWYGMTIQQVFESELVTDITTLRGWPE